MCSQNEAAQFSRVGVGRDCKYPDSDFSVRFEDCQRLQRFQWKLAQILPALEGNICALTTCEERWQSLPNHLGVQPTLIEIRGIIMQLEFHKAAIRKLAEQASRSTDLV